MNFPKKGLVNIQNIDDNECFKCCLVRYLTPADRNPAIITKADKGFVKKLNFKDIKFQVKASDIHKIEKKKKRIPSALAFLIMKIKKNIQSMYQ